MTHTCCGRAMLGGYNAALGGHGFYVCKVCGHEEPATRQQVGPLADPCEPPPDAYVGSESQLVQSIREAGVAHGFFVERIGQYRAKGAGNELGIPDLALRNPAWPTGHHVLCECKSLPDYHWEPPQRLRVEMRRSVAVWCVRQAREAVGL